MFFHPEIGDEQEFFTKMVSDCYFLPEVKANLAIMKHNMMIRQKFPDRLINSPILVEAGTLIDHTNSFYGKYLVFEALEGSDELGSDLKLLSDDKKALVKNELYKLHHFAKISHGDVRPHNLIIDKEGIPHFIDYDNSKFLTPENANEAKKDLEKCHEMLFEH